jgi:hypothetical protein
LERERDNGIRRRGIIDEDGYLTGIDEDSDDRDADSCWSKAWTEGLWENMDLKRLDVQTPFLAITVNREQFEGSQINIQSTHIQKTRVTVA